MKRTFVGIGAILLVVLLSSCLSFDSFFPLANPPVDEQVSMLVVEAGKWEDGRSNALFNATATGWAPWVEDEWGNLVPFRAFDAEARLDSLYWAENLKAGTYTLKGFLHVHVDYSLLPEGVLMDYEPFAGRPWHKTQRFALEEPVQIKLAAGDLQTFGRYYITANWREGLAGTGDLRWQVVPSSVKIEGDANDKKALRVMKNWATKTWLAWNTRNTETAADN